MVTTRNTGSKASSMKINFETYLKDYGTTVTLNKFTDVFDSMGRLTGQTTVSTSIQADIQWSSKHDIKHENIGDIPIGDGMLFVRIDSGISLEDEIVYNDKTYRIVSQIEGEQVGGELVYLGYQITLND